jgi:hypothetical protein
VAILRKNRMWPPNSRPSKGLSSRKTKANATQSEEEQIGRYPYKNQPPCHTVGRPTVVTDKVQENVLASLNLSNQCFVSDKDLAEMKAAEEGEKNADLAAKMILVTRGENGDNLFAVSSGLAAGMGMVKDQHRNVENSARSNSREMNVIKAGVKVCEKDTLGRWNLTMTGAAVMKDAACKQGISSM